MEYIDIPDDQILMFKEPEATNEDPYPGIETKKKILRFFRSGKKLKDLKKMQHAYRQLKNLRTLYKWEAELANGKIHI